MKFRNQLLSGLVAILMIFGWASTTSAQYDEGRICQGTYAGNGTLSCRYYAYEGDVLTLWCEGCRYRGTNIFGREAIPAWRFIFRGSNDVWDQNSDPLLLSSNRGGQQTYTVTREGMHQLTAYFDFGTTTTAQESYTYITDDPNRCGQIGCMGMEVEVVTNPGSTTANTGTIRTYINLDRPGADSPHNPANQATATPRPTATPVSVAAEFSDTVSGSFSSALEGDFDEIPLPVIGIVAAIGLFILYRILRAMSGGGDSSNYTPPPPAKSDYSKPGNKYGTTPSSRQTSQVKPKPAVNPWKKTVSPKMPDVNASADTPPTDSKPENPWKK